MKGKVKIVYQSKQFFLFLFIEINKLYGYSV
jgi:hypothetical protein